MRTAPLLWPISALVGSAAAACVVFVRLTPAVRAPVALAFLLVCPGFALTRLLRLGELATELTVALALSVALDAAVAGSLVYAGAWNPDVAFGVVLGVVVSCAAVDAAWTVSRGRGA
jgi:hypothetical protein